MHVPVLSENNIALQLQKISLLIHIQNVGTSYMVWENTISQSTTIVQQTSPLFQESVSTTVWLTDVTINQVKADQTTQYLHSLNVAFTSRQNINMQ